MTQPSTRQMLTLLILFLLTALAIAPDNSESRRLTFHEILVAQTATEMLERNDFLVPYFMDEPRLKKPPLNYWLAVITHRILGKADSHHVNELEARLPSMIAALLLVLVTFGLGALVTRDSRGGLIAAGFVVTSAAFFTFSHSARPEMLYALLCTLMVFGFLLALRRAEEGRSTRGAAALCWAAFGLSLLAKGPQFPLFIFIGIALTLLLRKPRTPISGILHPWMLLPALLIPLAYYLYLALQVDDAIALWSSEMVQGEDVPLWQRPLRLYYPTVLIASLAPWLVAVVATTVDVWKRRDRSVQILVNCVLVSLVIVSFAGKLREHYVLPLLPICAAVMAATLLRTFDSSRGQAPLPRPLRLLVWSQYGLAGVIMATVIINHVWFEMEKDAVSRISLVILLLGLASILYLAAGIQIKRNLARAFASLVGALLLALAALPWMSFERSGNAEASYQFIKEVEAVVPGQSLLYFDHGKQLLEFEKYYSKGKMQPLQLQEWIALGKDGPAPYFVSTYGRVRDSGIPGEFIIKERIEAEKEDNARVLFQPATRN